MHTGQNIRRVLDMLECSQVELLREAEGVSESQLSNYLSGRRLPSVAQRDAIARAVSRLVAARLDAAVAADERARRQ